MVSMIGTMEPMLLIVIDATNLELEANESENLNQRKEKQRSPWLRFRVSVREKGKQKKKKKTDRSLDSGKRYHDRKIFFSLITK